MKKFFTYLLFLGMALPVFAQLQDPVKWTFKVNDINESESELVFIAQLDEGWHLYSQYTDPNGPIAIYFEFNKSDEYKLVGKVQEPKPHEEFDEDFKCTVRSFSGKVVFRQKIERLSTKDFKVTGTFGYQLCNQGSCIAPDDRDFSFKVKGAKMLLADDKTDDGSLVVDTGVAALPEELEQSDGADVSGQAEETVLSNQSDSEEKENMSLISIFLWALLGGVLTMFTPCVFPMIPMTINFFMNSSASKKAARRQAWFFGFSIVFLFAFLGAILTLIFGPQVLYAMGTHWVPNLIFFLIFLVFSLSFFGLFEIKMPEKWINKSDEQADKGGLLAPFFIALTTVLVSFSCTGHVRKT